MKSDMTFISTQERKTALFHAVEKGHILIVKELLDAGANTETANKVCVQFGDLLPQYTLKTRFAQNQHKNNILIFVLYVTKRIPWLQSSIHKLSMLECAVTFHPLWWCFKNKRVTIVILHIIHLNSAVWKHKRSFRFNNIQGKLLTLEVSIFFLFHCRTVRPLSLEQHRRNTLVSCLFCWRRAPV